jgi:thioredoxin-dependent peroxiredoxin
MTQLNEGAALPNIVLAHRFATTRGQASLADFAGHNLVAYFYPKDSTPGCTVEGNDFSALHQQFLAADTQVVGVSRDSLKSHQNFIDKQGLTITLISDSDEFLCKAFDVIKEKTMYGKKVLGIERSTFLIDAKGVLRKEWRGVKVPGHAQEVLAAAKALG